MKHLKLYTDVRSGCNVKAYSFVEAQKMLSLSRQQAKNFLTTEAIN